jgi:hypothetical protein
MEARELIDDITHGPVTDIIHNNNMIANIKIKVAVCLPVCVFSSGW